jgi:hypothetical protein
VGRRLGVLRHEPAARTAPAVPTGDERDALDPAVVADLIAWAADAPGQPLLDEVTITPLHEGGWP